MFGVNVADCHQWPLSEWDINWQFLNYGFILIKGWNQTWHILTSLIIDNNLDPASLATPNTMEIKLKTFNDPTCLPACLPGGSSVDLCTDWGEPGSTWDTFNCETKSYCPAHGTPNTPTPNSQQKINIVRAWSRTPGRNRRSDWLEFYSMQVQGGYFSFSAASYFSLEPVEDKQTFKVFLVWVFHLPPMWKLRSSN